MDTKSTSVIKTTMDDMMETFTKQMAAFETRLQEKEPTPTVSSLAADFASFKSFMLASLRALQGQVASLASSLDRMEMHSRRKILLIHGVPESAKEDPAVAIVDVAVKNLKLAEFSVKDISRCHRMGRQLTSRPRPLLVKLRDVSVRDKLWFAKASLKDSGITLSEFLTKTRHELFMKAREHFGVSRCWTRDGKIYVGGPDFTRHCISSATELQQLLSVQLKPPGAPKEIPIPAEAGTSKPQLKSKRIKKTLGST